MSDFDVTICTVTRDLYMAMLKEFRTINPNLRDRVDDPPKEDDDIAYVALVGKFKWEPWPALFGANPVDNFRLGAAWVNTSTGYIGGMFETNRHSDVQVAPFLLDALKALGGTGLERFDG